MNFLLQLIRSRYFLWVMLGLPFVIMIIEYSRDLFDASTMRRLLGHLHHLLRDAAAQPEKAVTRLDLISAAERHQALVEFNATAQEIPGRTTLLDLIEEQERSRPQAVALTFGDQALSYAGEPRATG